MCTTELTQAAGRSLVFCMSPMFFFDLYCVVVWFYIGFILQFLFHFVTCCWYMNDFNRHTWGIIVVTW